MSSSELLTLFDACPHGVFLVDLEGRVTAANRSARCLFDLDPELSLETVWFTEFLESADAQMVREHLAELALVAESGRPDPKVRMLDVYIQPEKTEGRWFEVTMSLNLGNTHTSRLNCASIIVVLADITRHKTIESDLQRQNEKLVRDLAKLSRKMREETRQAQLNYQVAGEQIQLVRDEKKLSDELGARWRSLTENAPQTVMLADRKGKVLFCNRMSASADSNAKSGKRTVQDFIPAQDSSKVRQIIEDVLRQKQNKAYEVNGIDADGNPVWHSISVGPVVTKPGERAESVVLIATDVTQRKLAEESVAKHQEELAHVSRLASMGALTVELAHELNQPLGVIANYVGGCIVAMERPGWDRNRIAQAQHKILGETKRAREITLRILDFLRRRESPRMLTDMNWLLRDTLPLADLEAQKYQVTLLHDGPPDLPEVKVNRVQIQQILINLISNAVQSVAAAAPAKPHVKITTRRVDVDGIEVSVSDNGNGFDPKSADQLFKPLYTTKEKGTGMGLSICRTLVELHGGRITATATPGSGATFTFTIPKYDSDRDAMRVRAEFGAPEVAR
ncbi:MAG: sensor histidine kinase [Planctomycetaceae bacterium]|nr:sensor histidine kinase [Planctomycetaceae bacterium]